MKRRIGEKNRWDPLVVRLVERKVKKTLWANQFKRHETSVIKEKAIAFQERRSKEDFEAYLKSLFDNNLLKAKYRNPDAWYVYNVKRKRNCR